MARYKEGFEARLGFRLPLEVAEDWKMRARADGLCLSDWLRGVIDAQAVTGKPTPDIAPIKSVYREDNGCDPVLIQQLARIGNNLNQIARALNECRKAGDVVQVVEVLAVLRSNEEAIAELFPQLPKPPKLNGLTNAH